MLLWRITNHPELDGGGGLVASGRWHTRGHRITYFAENPAGALLETMVHLELTPDTLPSSFMLLKAEAPDAIAVETIGDIGFPDNWRNDSVFTRTIGDEWLIANRVPLVRVPSAILPETYNVLSNPRHPDASQITIAWHRTYPWDQRLVSAKS